MTVPASSFADLVKVYTATTGNGTMTLGSAVSGFAGTSALGNNTLYSYSISDSNAAYEAGQGTYLTSGTTLSRTTVYESSNANTTITLSGGAIVTITALSKDFPDFGRRRLLGKLIGANMNSTADQAITLTQPGTGPWCITSILGANPSRSMTSAQGTFYAAASKTNVIPGNSGATSGFTSFVASTDILEVGIPIGPNFGFTGTSLMHFSYFGAGTASTTIYLSLTTGQGVAATIDFYIFGYDLS